MKSLSWQSRTGLAAFPAAVALMLLVAAGVRPAPADKAPPTSTAPGPARDGRALPAAPGHGQAMAGTAGGRLYAATVGGLFTSPDGGESWRAVSIDGADEEILSVTVEAGDPAHVLAGRRDGLWQSRDGGQSWARAALPAPDSPVPLAIAVGANGRPIYVATARHGILRSDDGGHHWVAPGSGLVEVTGGARPLEIRALAVDPRQPSTLYAAHDRHGVFRSTDAGMSWRPLNDGLPRPLSAPGYPPQLAHAPDEPPGPYLITGQRLHSHQVRGRAWVLVGDRWRPLEVDLPPGVVARGLAVSGPGRILEVWGDDGLHRLSLPPALPGRRPGQARP